MKDYVVKRPAANDDYWRQVDDGMSCLGRTVYEERELIDIGIVDQNGDKIMARKRMDPIGFIRFPDRG